MEIGKNIFNIYSKQPKWLTATEIILVCQPAITFSSMAPFYRINMGIASQSSLTLFKLCEDQELLPQSKMTKLYIAIFITYTKN